eukprot:m.351485 g.351485  ORF g.351485 m.351485 type:complete len:192 (-) comp16258_c0_seq1:1119-1694(-)
MACKHSILSLLSLLVVVAMLFPQVSWIKGEVALSDGSGNENYTASIWETCTWGQGEEKNCTFFKAWEPSEYKNFDEDTGLRAGAIAGALLAGLVSVVVFLTTACSNKCAAVSFALVQFVFATAVLGCQVRTFWIYGGIKGGDPTAQTHLIDPKFTYGFGFTCLHFLLVLGGSIAACCMPKRNSEYTELNYA